MSSERRSERRSPFGAAKLTPDLLIARAYFRDSWFSRLRPGYFFGRSPARRRSCRSIGRQSLDTKGRVETLATVGECECHAAFDRCHQDTVMRWRSSPESFEWQGDASDSANSHALIQFRSFVSMPLMARFPVGNPVRVCKMGSRNWGKNFPTRSSTPSRMSDRNCGVASSTFGGSTPEVTSKP